MEKGKGIWVAGDWERARIGISHDLLEATITFTLEGDPVLVAELMEWFSPVPTLNEFKLIVKNLDRSILLISELTGGQRRFIAKSYWLLHGEVADPSDEMISEAFLRLNNIFQAIFHGEKIARVDQTS